MPEPIQADLRRPASDPATRRTHQTIAKIDDDLMRTILEVGL